MSYQVMVEKKLVEANNEIAELKRTSIPTSKLEELIKNKGWSVPISANNDGLVIDCDDLQTLIDEAKK